MSGNVPDVGAAFQRHTNEILSRLEAGNARLSEQLAGQAKLLTEGLGSVQDQIKEQTKALGEMEIIKRLAEMQAILELIQQEVQYAESEQREDASDLEELEKYFEDRRQEIENARNDQVGRLIMPIAKAVDKELRETLEERRMNGVVPLLRECFQATEETVQEREGTMKTVISKSQAMVEAFIRQRREIRAAVAGFQTEPGEIADVDPAGTALAVPFYVVEVAESHGAESAAEIVGPAWIAASEENPVGFSLRAIPGFEMVARSLGQRLASFHRLFGGQGSVGSVTVAEALSDRPFPGGLAGLAWKSMLKHLAKRNITYRFQGSPESSLAHEYRHQAPAGGGYHE